jgi:hypothetical protein
MGYNNENAARYVFDIETAPLPEAVDYLEPAEPPANYKDPEKIAAYISSKNAENLDRCGLDVDLCRVVAIGLMNERMDRPCDGDHGRTTRPRCCGCSGRPWRART